MIELMLSLLLADPQVAPQQPEEAKLQQVSAEANEPETLVCHKTYDPKASYGNMIKMRKVCKTKAEWVEAKSR